MELFTSLPGNLSRVAQLIQLAVAPIFLLTAVATTLTLFAGRLSRIVDRGRTLENRASSEARDLELALLETRARLIYRALFLGVCAALGVCLFMTIVFVGSVYDLRVARPVALLFLGSLFVYTSALLCLLREVQLAVGAFKLGLPPTDKPRANA